MTLDVLKGLEFAKKCIKQHLNVPYEAMKKIGV